MKLPFLTTVFFAVCIATPAFADFVVESYAGPVSGGITPSTSPIGGDAYFIAPGIGNSNGFILAGGPFENSTVDGVAEDIGADLVVGRVISNDTFTDNGDGNFDLTLTISSTSGELAPTGFADANGLAFDSFGVFMGANAVADPLDLHPHTVNSAMVELFNGAGISFGTFDITNLPEFSAGPGGGWDGSIGLIFAGPGPGPLGIGIASVTLTVNGDKASAIPEPTSATIAMAFALGLLSRRRR